MENTARYYRASFDYEAQGDSDISFQAGDILLIYDDSGEWWYGQVENGPAGWIPPSYLHPSPLVYDDNAIENPRSRHNNTGVDNGFDNAYGTSLAQEVVIMGTCGGGEQEGDLALADAASSSRLYINGPPPLSAPPSGSSSPNKYSSRSKSVDKGDSFDDAFNVVIGAAPVLLADDFNEEDDGFANDMDMFYHKNSSSFQELSKLVCYNKEQDEESSPEYEQSIPQVAVHAAPTDRLEVVSAVARVFIDQFLLTIGSLVGTMGKKDCASAIDVMSDHIIAGMIADGVGHEIEYDEYDFESEDAETSAIHVEAKEVVSNTAVEMIEMQPTREINLLADHLIQNCLSGAVVRIAERLLNKRYRDNHARTVTRTLSRSMSNMQRERSMSLSTYEPERVVSVSHLLEAKRRLLSMENIQLVTPPPEQRRTSQPVTLPGNNLESIELEYVEPLLNKGDRPKTAPQLKRGGSKLPIRTGIDFNILLRNRTCSSREFIKLFQLQRAQLARKNAKNVFEALRGAIAGGEFVTLSIHDYMSTAVVPGGKGQKSGSNLMPIKTRAPLHKKTKSKRERTHKDGIAVIVDPGIDTTGLRVFLHFTYGAQFELSETIKISNDGSYCGLELTGAKWSLDPISPLISPHQKRSSETPDLGRLAASANFDETERRLPGWNGTLPIYIPWHCFKCRIEVQRMDEVDLSSSPLRFYMGSSTPSCNLQRPWSSPKSPLLRSDSFNLLPRKTEDFEKLTIFCYKSRGLDSALRKVSDQVGSKLKVEFANDDAGGGISALNVAALHGNMEAIHHLVEVAGASVNARCKKTNHTPLHEAVIGGHADVVKFLLLHGANALIRNDTNSLPIHIACAANHILIVRLLLGAKHGKKSLLTKDGSGNTPRQLCASKFLRTIVEDTMRKMYIYKTCILFEKGHRGDELYEELIKPCRPPRPKSAAALSRPGLVY